LFQAVRRSPRSFHKYCIFVKNSLYLLYPLILLMKRVLQLKQRSKSISNAGARQLTRLRIYIPPLLNEKGASVDQEGIYAQSMNEKQRKLDEQYGQWAQHAL
jgi:hypothetical protein